MLRRSSDMFARDVLLLYLIIIIVAHLSRVFRIKHRTTLYVDTTMYTRGNTHSARTTTSRILVINHKTNIHTLDSHFASYHQVQRKRCVRARTRSTRGDSSAWPRNNTLNRDGESAYRYNLRACDADWTNVFIEPGSAAQRLRHVAY